MIIPADNFTFAAYQGGEYGEHVTICGDVRDALRLLPDESVQCVVTSPPYWGLRDYGTAEWEGGDANCNHKNGVLASPKSALKGYTGNHVKLANEGMPYRNICGKCGARRIDKQIGLESTPEEYVTTMVNVFREVRRVLRNDGTLWLNLGDSYMGDTPGSRNPNRWPKQSRNDHVPPKPRPQGLLKPKDLVGMPWRVALALQADGWWLRMDNIWHKPNPMPESVTDRTTKAHEYMFHFSKSARYYYDADAIREPLSKPNTGNGVTTDWAKVEDGRQKSAHRRTPPSRKSGYIGPENGRNKRSVWTLATQPFTRWIRTYHRVHVQGDVPDDDTRRITSPNCPVHGGRLVHLPNGAYGERADDGSIRNVHTYSHPDQELIIGYETIDQTPASGFAGENSDYLSPEYFPFAIDHNIGTSKTALARLTNQPYSISDKMFYHIDGKLILLCLADSVARTSVNNIERACSDGLLSVQKASHNVSISSFKSSDCLCEYYKVKSLKSSHFATFPPKLIQPCILAGSSNRACEHCGAPWMRVIETKDHANSLGKSWNDHNNDLQRGQRGCPSANKTPMVKTIGWRSSCKHDNKGSGNSIVLDPFGGSGTTAMVAKHYGRRSIMIELNEKYAAMRDEEMAQEVLKL